MLQIFPLLFFLFLFRSLILLLFDQPVALQGENRLLNGSEIPSFHSPSLLIKVQQDGLADNYKSEVFSRFSVDKIKSFKKKKYFLPENLGSFSWCFLNGGQILFKKKNPKISISILKSRLDKVEKNFPQLLGRRKFLLNWFGFRKIKRKKQYRQNNLTKFGKKC